MTTTQRKTLTMRSYKLPVDVVAGLSQIGEAHGGNSTAALCAMVRTALRPTLTLVSVPGRSGAWVPATPTDWALELELAKPKDGKRIDPATRIHRLLSAAAQAGIAVVFRPG
jgi:hypothetical protein